MTTTSTNSTNAIPQNKSVLTRFFNFFATRPKSVAAHRKMRKAKPFHRSDNEIKLERAQQELNQFWTGQF